LISIVLAGVPYAGLEAVEYYIEKGVEDAFSLDAMGIPFSGAACPAPLRTIVTVIEGPALVFGCDL
jgi:hypothetical protein